MASSSNPTGGVGGVHPSVVVRAREVGPLKQYYIAPNGRTYMVEAFQKNPSTGAFDINITPLRDWTQIGKHAMEAANQVFTRQGEDFSKVKSIQVPLVGAVKITETETIGQGPVTLGQQIQFSTVSNTPDQSITIAPETQTHITTEISKIGAETAIWKNPTTLYTQANQSGSAASTRTETPVPSNPTEPPSTADSTATTETPITNIPPLPAQSNASPDALLTSFLKSQVTTANPDHINASARNTSAADALAAQINQIRPDATVTADSLQKGAAKHIVDNIDSYKSEPDIKDMLKVLRKCYDSPSRDASRLQGAVQQGAKEIKEAQYRELPSILDRPDPVTLTEAEKKLVATAFANYLHNANATTDQSAYPNVFFKAALNFVNAPRSWIGSLTSRTPEQLPISLVIASEKDGNYESRYRFPEGGARISSSQTAFILYNENPIGAVGKYSQFRRESMTTRDPFAELPRALDSTAMRPAYYSAGELNIETGGGGNCAASALADAVMQKDSRYYGSKADWKTQLESDKATIRHQAMSHMFNHPEDFLVEVNGVQMFDEIRSAILDSQADIRLAYPQQAESLNALLRKTTPLTENEKKSLIKLYAHYATQKNKDLDNPFFLAYAKATGTKIAIIKDNEIYFVAPPNVDKAIDPSEYLFVRFTPGHYESINREVNAGDPTDLTPGTAFLNQIVARYNAKNAPAIAIRAFLGSILDTTTLPQNLAKLKVVAPHAYLALQELVGPDLLTGAIERNEIDPLIAALTEKANPVGDTSAALATAVETVFNSRTDLQARAQFLTKLIEAKNTRPGSEAVDSPIQQQLRAALTTLKQEDTAGYLAFRANLGGDDLSSVPNDLDMNPLFDMDLHITTTLAGTDLTAMPVAVARQNEIAKRNALMLIEAGTTVADHLEADPAKKARAEFLQALMKASTTAPLGTDTTDNLRRIETQLKTIDPKGYFAYRAFLAANPDIGGSLQALVANRDRAMAAILRPANNARIKAQANVIKAVHKKNVEEITRSLQHLKDTQPQDYLALEMLFPEGDLPPDQMSVKLQAIMNTPVEVSKLTTDFAIRIHSPATKGLFDFIGAFELYKGQLELNAEARPDVYNGSHARLKDENLPAYLAIENMYLQNTDHREVLHASTYAVKHKSTAEVKKAVVDSSKAMNARAQFLTSLKAANEVPTAMTTPALVAAITKMQSDDIHGFLGLIEITKKTNPNEIAANVLDRREIFAATEKLFVPFVERMEGHDLDRRAIYNPPLEQTIYSPALLARGNLMQAAMKEPHAITEQLWTSVRDNDPLGALVLGKLIYEIDKGVRDKIPHDAEVGTSAQQIAYGMAQIQDHPERIAEILPKFNEFVQLLATKKPNEDANDLEPI